MDYQNIKKLDTKTKLGKRIVRALITEQKQKKLSAHFKDRSRTKMIREVCSDKKSNLKDLFQTCLKHLMPITTPLALISQAKYSGGSRLSRLFDGHPELYACPPEFMIGLAAKAQWSQIDLKDEPQRWFDIFSEDIDIDNIQKGGQQEEIHNVKLPFLFLPYLQKQFFFKYLESVQPIEPRDVFDEFVTSIYGAWLNYQNHYQNKKFVTVFAPGPPRLKENMRGFFEIYPDGRIISLIRNPQTWFASASANEPEVYGNIKGAIAHWQESVHAALWIKKRFGERVSLIQYEDLIARRESLMRYVANFLQLTYEDVLLNPTFNNYPTHPTTMQDMDSIALDEDQRVFIEQTADEDYQTVLREVVVL
jgi:hypothetical protein